MLFHIVNTRDNDGAFQVFISDIKSLYYPREVFNERIGQQPPIEASKIAELVANEELYRLYSDDLTILRPERLPFLDRFYQFFLQRRWDYPIEDADRQIENLSRLYPPDPPNHLPPPVNFSKNYAQYNHFINVLAALSRSIDYFKKVENIEKLLSGINQENPSVYYSEIAYEDPDDPVRSFPNLRTFKLMLAGFYHDIGKTVVDARHGMEGAMILSFHASKSRYQFNEIVRLYNRNYRFEIDDLLYLSEIINYHDSFGTISTGEDGYNPLAKIVDFVKRYGVIFAKKSWDDRNGEIEAEIQEQIKWSKRSLFDLWLLNVADIMVSLENKYQLQNGGESPDEPGDQQTIYPNWMKREEAHQYIEEFLRSDKGQCLTHDLKIALEMLWEHHQKKHTDDTMNLSQIALGYSNRHAIERVRRLLRSSLRKPLAKFSSEVEIKKAIGDRFMPPVPVNRSKIEIIQEITKKIDRIVIYDENWNLSLATAIESICNLQEFCRKFSLIGKMDYSLGFFQTIADEIFLQIARAILLDNDCPGWFKKRNVRDFGGDRNYLYSVHARFIADNYAALVIQILSYLLFREPSIDRIRNLEFRDATQRLTPEKIQQIIVLEGLFRLRKSIQLILQTISMF